MTAGIFQHFRVVNIILFIKTRTQLEQTENILAPVRRIRKGCGNFTAAGHTVERDADGTDIRVICCFINQIHKREHALEGKTHQEIMLFDITEIFTFFQSDIPGRLTVRILKGSRAADTRTERKIKRHILCKYAAFRNMQLLDQQCPAGIGQLAINSCPYRHFSFPLAEHAGHFVPQVIVRLNFIFCQENICITGDIHHRRLQNVFLFQEKREEMADKKGSRDNFLTSVNFETLVSRYPVQRNNTQFLFCVASEESDDMCFSAPEKRKRLIRCDDFRKEQIPDIAEQLFAHQLIDLADFAEIQHVNFIGMQFLTDGFPDALHQRLLFSRDAKDFRDLSLGKHTGQGIRCIRCKEGTVGKDTDAHTVEFFQIGLIDHEKLQTFQKRYVRISRFQQNTAVKGKPAQFTVNIYAFRLDGFVLLLLGRHTQIIPL